MSLAIDDSAFPSPAPLPTFASLADGKDYRTQQGQYRHKLNAAFAHDYIELTAVNQASSDIVQEVVLTLKVTAPV